MSSYARMIFVALSAVFDGMCNASVNFGPSLMNLPVTAANNTPAEYTITSHNYSHQKHRTTPCLLYGKSHSRNLYCIGLKHAQTHPDTPGLRHSMHKPFHPHSYLRV